MTVIPFKRPLSKTNADVKEGSLPSDSKTSKNFDESTMANKNLGATTPRVKIPKIKIPVGIDLGTTNSVVSVYEDPLPETILYYGAPLVPSVLYVNAETRNEYCGRQALEESEKSNGAAEVIRSSKTKLGKKNIELHSNGESFSPREVAEKILRYLSSHEKLQKAKTKAGILPAVITVPARFDDAARRATMQAAESAGIQVVRILNEPTAAALAYSYLEGIDRSAQEILAVYDLGGGTFDVTIVQRKGLVFEVLSSEGDVHLGGDDCDIQIAKSLVSFIENELSKQRILKFFSNLENVKKITSHSRAKGDSKDSILDLVLHLVEIATQVKCEMGLNGTLELEKFSTQHLKLKGTYLRDVLEEACEELIQRTVQLTRSAMRSAGVNSNSVSRILLVGGSTRLPLVRKLLEAAFSSKGVNCEVDARLEPDLAVSWGACLQAAMLAGMEPSTVLVDVCSHSLGIGVAEDIRGVEATLKKVKKQFGIVGNTSENSMRDFLGDRFSDFEKALHSELNVAKIIHRNTSLPAVNSEFFNTIFENQRAVQIVLVEGEGAQVQDCRWIGSAFFWLEQPCPLGSKCEIQLTYDASGMIQVLAKQVGTSNSAVARFDSDTGEFLEWKNVSNGSNSSDLIDSDEYSETGEIGETVETGDGVHVENEQRVLPKTFGEFAAMGPTNDILKKSFQLWKKTKNNTDLEFAILTYQKILRILQDFAGGSGLPSRNEEFWEKELEATEALLEEFLAHAP